ncbi:MAG: NUDIX hydrolase [Patescibacteria group bacterium]
MAESIILQVGVKVFLKNPRGRYLLLERSPTRYPNVKNRWDIPGGRIFPGTPLLENIKREVFEETRLSMVSEPKLIAAQDIIRLPEKHIVRLTFLAETKGEPALDKEHLSYKWVTLKEMRVLKKLDEFTREILERDSSQF